MGQHGSEARVNMLWMVVMVRKVVQIFVGMAALIALMHPAQAAMGPYGDWLLDNGQLVVRVTPCGGNVCANVVWLPEPNNADGTPKLDLKNPSPALKSRHVIGMPLLENMAPAGPNLWRGLVYSADDGAYYHATAHVDGDKLQVKGCWLVFCKDLNFNRKK